ncbi:MAG: hypothetical protein AAB972_00970, partial [Patescibacteria group bacterium]
DRPNINVRGSRIVCDIPVGKKGQAASTKSKLDPRFMEIIKHIRDRGFQPDHRYHVSQFDLSHSDSFHTVSKEEINGIPQRN